MKIRKRILAGLLVIVLVFSGAYINNGDVIKAEEMSEEQTTEAEITEKDLREQWKNTAIVSPVQDRLVGAGYIDIKWKNTLKNVTAYKVYVDSKLQKTVKPTSAEVMSCEFYTTSVSAHNTYVMAQFNDGASVKTPTIRFYVTKKGICVNDKDMGLKVDPATMNIGWYYNWSPHSFKDKAVLENDGKPINEKFDNVEFVPMIWGDVNYNIKDAFTNAKTQGYKYMLAYNEPDLRWEANMQVDTVCSYRWPQFMSNKGNMRLGSPAVSTFPTWSTNWWEPYWNRVKNNKNLQFDFIAIHSYQGNYDGTKSAKLYLQAIDECYETYHKPIWITEFAVAGNKWFNINNSSDCKKVQDFMKVVLKGLNERSYVERYCWFSFSAEPTANDAKAHEKAGASALFKYSTGALTQLGKIYAQIGNPSGYKAKTYGVSSGTNISTTPAACIAVMPTTLYSLTAKKKAFRYEIKSVSKASGYQLQYSLSSKFKKLRKYNTKTKTLKPSKGKTVKGYIKKLKAKKKYYVRVRAYKVLNGKKLYCKWSSKEKVKTKK